MGVYHPDPEAFDPEIVSLLDEMVRDISFALDNFDRERMRQEAVSEASKSQERFRAYFDSALIGMVALSPDGHFLEANESFLHMTGYTRSELFARKWEEIKDPEDRYAAREDYDRVMRGEIDFYRKDKRLLRSDGQIIYGHTAVRAVRKSTGEVDYFVINIEDVTEKKKSQEMIWRQANFDLLTGLPNRFMFLDRLKEEIKKSHRGDVSLALLFIDLDRFKEVNDTLGHQTGDKLLIEAASRISSCIRESDTVSRFGGDEFTVILSHVHAADHIEEVAQNILDRLSFPFVLGEDEESVFISASIGITVYPADGSDADKLLQNADQSMYVAKNSGRNRFAYFTSALQEKALRRLVLLNELRNALALSEFGLYFQPIMDLKTGKIVKAEALLRWHHPKLGMICPGEFIAITEETGLIVEIGDFVFREAARWVKHWAKISPEGFQVSVNMSTVQFQSKSPFMAEWFAYIDSLSLPGKSLTIEITESLLLDIEKSVTEKLKAFAGKGIQISIDDFGTGYSSLSYLLKFHIDYLKIDQSFVKSLDTRNGNLAMAEAIVIMGHKMGLAVIAEGVETPGQRDLLASIGCDFGQGFFFAHPLSPSEFEDFLGRFS
jgi:diguanylate cyclase (GGDEF)-like protein/PAS domain S-box-containing protein